MIVECEYQYIGFGRIKAASALVLGSIFLLDADSSLSESLFSPTNYIAR